MEGSYTGRPGEVMAIDGHYKSGKSAHDENFPVASRVIAPKFRTPILAFYRFARAADDAADHPRLPQSDKLEILAALEDTLLGKSNAAADAVPLRESLRTAKLSPQHALDLLVAFRQDVRQQRYQSWNDLIGYCRYSAMPVGRFVLDVHGEPRTTWVASDALCAALQIINHLQDCGKDYRALDRVYIPLDDLARHGATLDALSAPSASPQLRDCLRALAVKTEALIPQAALLPRTVNDLRLSVETAVIADVARRLLTLLKSRDPLSETVHLTRSQAAVTAIVATAGALAGRLKGGRSALMSSAKDDAA